MGALSVGDKALLRQPIDLQSSKERLYFQGHPNLWTGRVNEAPARGDRSITYDGGAMAAGFAWAEMANYWAGLEVWFGSAAGLKDRGVRRLRTMGAAEAAGTMVVDWHDEIDLQEDDFITIKHAYPPWPKYSYFTAAGPVFYKDGPDGTIYAASGDANDTPAPHVIMGRHYAGEMPAVGNLSIQCDATNSVDVAGGGGGVTYSWAVRPSGTASFDFPAIGNPILTIAAAGRFWIHCTVTIDGRSTIGHRAVLVGGGISEFQRSPTTSQYDKTDIAVTLTPTSPEVGAGGAIRGVMTWSDVQDHGLAIITSEDWYNATQKTISFRDDGVYDDRQHVVFCGYLVLENDDLFPSGKGNVELQAVSLVDMFLYSQSLTGVAAASQWYEMRNTLMTVAGNLLYLLRWHSTLLDIADWWLPWSDVVRRSANEEFSEGALLERGRELARARIMAITANPQGEIFVETDLNLRSAAERAAETTTLTLAEADVAAIKRVRTRRRGDTVRVLTDGGYSTGIMGSFQPFFAASQNVALAEARPALVHIDRLMLPDQAESNRLAARLQAVANRRNIEINLDFAGNYREVFSPADQQWTNLGNLFAASLVANLRGDTSLVDANVVPRQVTHAHDNATGRTSVSAIFDVEAPVELEGRTITPPSVPSEDPADGTWDMPEPPEWPPPPDFTLTGTLLAFDAAEGLWVRFVGASDWVERNGTRTGADDDDVQGGWDPWWFTAAKQNSTDPNKAILWACQLGKIWRSMDCGQSWVDMSPNITDPPNSWGDATPPTLAGLTFVQRTDNIHVNKEHYFLAEWQEPLGSAWRGWLLKTDDDGNLGSWEWKALGNTGLVQGFTFDAGAEDWEFAQVVGGGTSGAWDGITGRTAPGSLKITIPAGGTYDARWTYPPAAGLIVRSGDTFTAWITHTGDATNNHWLAILYTDGSYDMSNVINANGAWQLCTLTVPAGSDGKEIDLLHVQSNNGAGAGASVAHWDDIDISISSADVRPLWQDCDSEDGTRLYLTAWDSTNLVLYLYDTSDLTRQDAVSLGAASEAEVAARTYIAYPHTPTFDKDVCYVFGRMNAPAGLAGVQHVIYTSNGGAAWSSVNNALGGDHVGALRAEGTTLAARTLYAIRNDASGLVVAKLYSGVESLAYVSDLTFGVGVWVLVDALTINAAEAQIACGADTAGAIMIAISDSPFAAWVDITDSFPGGEVRSLTYV